jgi:hypothetical protein
MLSPALHPERRCNEERYKMVGDAYMEGLMNCEGFNSKDPKKEACFFIIV